LKSTSDTAWQTVDKTNINSLREYVKQYPSSVHVNEANNLINALLLDEIMGVDAETLVSQIRQFQTNRDLTPAQKDNNIVDTIEHFLKDQKITKEEFLKKIGEDKNLLSSGVVKRLVNTGTLSIADLLSVNIDRLFIQKMFNGESAQSFSTPEKLDKIHKQSTEIYFWGIPSSGKSCALGAILSVAASGRVARSMDPDTASQGYGYMMKLINLFQNGEVGTLMEGTSVDSFYEMGFDLVDTDNKIHPITCIDMAGELMRCMFKANAGDPMSETDEVMLDTMTKVLIDNRSTSRKMHIFVIEYGAEDRLYEGLPQRVYLEGAVSYIKNTGIFRKDTDAIYIMITKADKVKHATRDTFNDYINEKYLGFYNGLEQICKDNEINKGKVEKLAFSLGEVCFQNYCRFNSRPAENVVNIILQRSASFRGGKMGMFEKIFRG
jgi:GTP-binding protein EngB required for normal cell division